MKSFFQQTKYVYLIVFSAISGAGYVFVDPEKYPLWEGLIGFFFWAGLVAILIKFFLGKTEKE